MTLFWAVAVALTALALLFILPPLLRRAGTRVVAADDRVVNVYQSQFAELEADHARNLLDPEQYGAARDELERRMIAELDFAKAREMTPSASKPARFTAATLAVAVPVVAALAYLALGTHSAIDPPVLADGKQEITAARMERMVEQLKTRLQAQPDDIEGWQMLAMSQQVLGKHEEAARAYERVIALGSRTPDMLVRYANVLAKSAGGRLAGEPHRLVQEALTLDQNHVAALALAAHAEAEQGRPAAATVFWERMLKQLPSDAPMRAEVKELADDARRRAAALPR